MSTTSRCKKVEKNINEISIYIYIYIYIYMNETLSILRVHKSTQKSTMVQIFSLYCGTEILGSPFLSLKF